MRVVHADDPQRIFPCPGGIAASPDLRNVVSGRHLVAPERLLRDVRRGNRLDDFVGATDQDAAALARLFSPRVCGNRLQHVRSNLHALVDRLN